MEALPHCLIFWEIVLGLPSLSVKTGQRSTELFEGSEIGGFTGLRRCTPGLSFNFPQGDMWAWSPPEGFTCVNEVWFRKDTKLWFPIPRLITAYYHKRICHYPSGWRFCQTGSVTVSKGSRYGHSFECPDFREVVFVVGHNEHDRIYFHEDEDSYECHHRSPKQNARLAV